MRAPNAPWRDLVLDAAATTHARPGRVLALSLAVAVGIASFVAVLSVSSAARRQVQRRFDDIRPEHFELRPLGEAGELDLFPPDTVARLEALEGVVAASVVDVHPDVHVTARLTEDGAGADVTVLGVDGDIVASTGSVVEGRSFAGAELSVAARVAVVGEGVAARLGLAHPALEPAIWVEGVPFAVVGILEGSDRLREARDGVLVPRSTAAEVLGAEVDGAKAVLRVVRGSVEPVAAAAPVAVSPERPERWYADVPQRPEDVAGAVNADVRAMVLSLAGLAMLLGVVAIGNSMMRSVFERMPEIGLRRALGARSGQVVVLIVAEAAQVGAVGGVVGLVVGVVIAVGVAAQAGWPVTVSWAAAVVSLPVAVLSGAIAGLLPAYRAVAIAPSEALRRE